MKLQKISPRKQKERDAIIFGETPTDELYDKYGGPNGEDLYSFEGLSVESAEQLILKGYLKKMSGHNNSPTAKQMLAFANYAKGRADVTFGGYAAGGSRYAWVSLDGIEVVVHGNHPDIIQRFYETFKEADVHNASIRTTGATLSAWYD